MVKIFPGQDKANVIEGACRALAADDEPRALAISQSYPHTAPFSTSRNYAEIDCMRVFLRDQFTDRYSGTRLFNPGVLRVLSHRLADAFPFQKNRLADAFPFQKNWKVSETHPMYWELFPTLDHRHAVSREGVDGPENWVTTSMVRNSAKAHWTLEELGWTELPIEGIGAWDGLTSWLIDYVRARPEFRSHVYIMRWVRASERALRELVKSSAVVSVGLTREPSA